MHKKAMALALFMFCLTALQAQEKYFTKSGRITFFSEAPLEDIEAHHQTATAVLDTQSGALQFAVLMTGFAFKKALMQEHFNEDYVESHKYPRGEFKGTISNNSEIDYRRPGTYTARVRGQLTLHGVTRDVETTGTIRVEAGRLLAHSVFSIRLSDYNIKIPALVKDNISNEIKITVDTQLEPLKT